MGLFDFSNDDDDDEINIGDWVYVKSWGVEGEVIDIMGSQYEIQLEDDNDTVYFDKSDLKKLY